MEKSLSLDQARKIILENIALPPVETRDLSDCLGRVTVSSLYALIPRPAYTQSTYDGYVISRNLPTADGGSYCFNIQGEIAAGSIFPRKLGRGGTFRIMTGGLAPSGSWKVIPQELCREKDGVVRIVHDHVNNGPPNLRRKGSEQPRGALLVPPATVLGPAQLSRLAETGYHEIEVFVRPKVSFFCTGSELVDVPMRQPAGLKMSSNRYLLGGLITLFGGVSHDCGTVADDRKKMDEHLQMLACARADIIISTGGMGPGKYDLLEESFCRAGGTVLFSSLQMRPGKSTLAGILGKSLYFGLPGPPPAVQALFYALVRPALLRARGLRRIGSEKARAFLTEDIIIKRKGSLLLREAFVSQNQGKLLVRQVFSKEDVNAYILCPANRTRLRQGELVTVHLLEPPHFSF